MNREFDKTIWFQSYKWGDKTLIPGNHEDDAKIYLIDQTKMIFPEFDPNRRVIKKRSLIQEIKHRLTHAWYALKGGECD